MEVTVNNPQKGRLETIQVEFTEKNTTWFNCEKYGDVEKITDINGCLLISKGSYEYPILIYDVTRKDIDYDKQKAFLLKEEYI